MLVRSDDLIHADRHGAVVIPHGVAREVAKAAQLCGRREEPILKVARSPDFSLEGSSRHGRGRRDPLGARHAPSRTGDGGVLPSLRG